MAHLMPLPVDQEIGHYDVGVGFDAYGYSRGDWSAAKSMPVRRIVSAKDRSCTFEITTTNDGRLWAGHRPPSII
jgi:hypothetical protein